MIQKPDSKSTKDHSNQSSSSSSSIEPLLYLTRQTSQHLKSQICNSHSSDLTIPQILSLKSAILKSNTPSQITIPLPFSNSQSQSQNQRQFYTIVLLQNPLHEPIISDMTSNPIHSKSLPLPYLITTNNDKAIKAKTGKRKKRRIDLWKTQGRNDNTT